MAGFAQQIRHYVGLSLSLGLCLGLCLSLTGCSYQWQGFHTPASTSVLGDGSKTLKIAYVEQASLYPWVSYTLRSMARDEITLRKLAKWVDEGESDYTLGIRMPSFHISSYSSNREDVTLLYSANVQLELVVYHGASGAVAWRSGLIQYSERYENPTESSAIREVMTQAMYRAMDRLQQEF